MLFKFEVGEIIKFVHTVDGVASPVEAKITCDYVFSVKAASLKKGLLKVTDETSLLAKKSDLEMLVKLMLAQNLKLAEKEKEKDQEKAKVEHITKSPPTKRKEKMASKSESSEDERCEVSYMFKFS